MIIESISYTIETKGATSSDIFPGENGPIEMLVGDRKNIRAGLYTSRLRFLVTAITNIIGLHRIADRSSRPVKPALDRYNRRAMEMGGIVL
jgi:hypothetical protein